MVLVLTIILDELIPFWQIILLCICVQPGLRSNLFILLLLLLVEGFLVAEVKYNVQFQELTLQQPKKILLFPPHLNTCSDTGGTHGCS